MDTARVAFIAVEGADGSGSTTQAARLAARLRAEGRSVRLTCEPSEGPVGGLIRQMLAGRLVSSSDAVTSPRSRAEVFALLFAADRADHVQHVVLPALDAGAVVVTDRYHISSYAYQGLDLPDLAWLDALNAPFPRPDLTVFLDVPPEVCLRRMRAGRPHTDLFEHPETAARLRTAYLRAIDHLAGRGERIAVVDGRRSVAAVHRAVLDAVRTVLAAPEDDVRSVATPAPDTPTSGRRRTATPVVEWVAGEGPAGAAAGPRRGRTLRSPGGRS